MFMVYGQLRHTAAVGGEGYVKAVTDTQLVVGGGGRNNEFFNAVSRKFHSV
ncbi:MAG: hypothetical protein ACI8RD_013316, partial [Bacillariaceae sp.]